MTDPPDKTCVPKFLWPNGVEPVPSTGRSNCTVFLDHPELLFDYEMPSPVIPKDIDVPAYKRRAKVFKR